jgi:hypothetical protein
VYGWEKEEKAGRCVGEDLKKSCEKFWLFG